MFEKIIDTVISEDFFKACHLGVLIPSGLIILIMYLINEGIIKF